MDMLQCLCTSTPLHPHGTCVWGDIPKGLGIIVLAFKPFVEACQAGGKYINHLHYISNVRHSFSPFRLLGVHFILSLSPWPLIVVVL